MSINITSSDGLNKTITQEERTAQTVSSEAQYSETCPQDDTQNTETEGEYNFFIFDPSQLDSYLNFTTQSQPNLDVEEINLPEVQSDKIIINTGSKLPNDILKKYQLNPKIHEVLNSSLSIEDRINGLIQESRNIKKITGVQESAAVPAIPISTEFPNWIKATSASYENRLMKIDSNEISQIQAIINNPVHKNTNKVVKPKKANPVNKAEPKRRGRPKQDFSQLPKINIEQSEKKRDRVDNLSFNSKEINYLQNNILNNSFEDLDEIIKNVRKDVKVSRVEKRQREDEVSEPSHAQELNADLNNNEKKTKRS